jgi:hypothetical protein
VPSRWSRSPRACWLSCGCPRHSVLIEPESRL